MNSGARLYHPLVKPVFIQNAGIGRRMPSENRPLRVRLTPRIVKELLNFPL